MYWNKYDWNVSDDNEKDIVLSLYEDKCQSWCKNVESLVKEDILESDVINYLQTIAQVSINEYTFWTVWSLCCKKMFSPNPVQHYVGEK